MKKKNKIMIGLLASLSIFTTTTIVLASNGVEDDFNTSEKQVYQKENQDSRYGQMMEDKQDYGQGRNTQGHGRCHNNNNNRPSHHRQGTHQNQAFHR